MKLWWFVRNDVETISGKRIDLNYLFTVNDAVSRDALFTGFININSYLYFSNKVIFC